MKLEIRHHNSIYNNNISIKRIRRPGRAGRRALRHMALRALRPACSDLRETETERRRPSSVAARVLAAEPRHQGTTAGARAASSREGRDASSIHRHRMVTDQHGSRWGRGAGPLVKGMYIPLKRRLDRLQMLLLEVFKRLRQLWTPRQSNQTSKAQAFCLS